jgi:hypothetical protein
MREWLEEHLARQADTGEQMVPVSPVMAFLAETPVRNTGEQRAS